MHLVSNNTSDDPQKDSEDMRKAAGYLAQAAYCAEILCTIGKLGQIVLVECLKDIRQYDVREEKPFWIS